MRFSIFLFIAHCFFSACSGSGNKEDASNDTLPDSLKKVRMPDSIAIKKDFNVRFTSLINTLGSQNIEELNKFISPEFGLLIIESSTGAMPHFHIQKTDDQEYRHHIEMICNTISFDRNLREESLPRIDCEGKDGYTKSGSFVQDTNILSGSDVWKYGDLSPDDQNFAEHVIRSISKTVIITSGFTFYFSFSGDTWFLTIVDIRKPCQG